VWYVLFFGMILFVFFSGMIWIFFGIDLDLFGMIWICLEGFVKKTNGMIWIC
jgi:hypothetical protein